MAPAPALRACPYTDPFDQSIWNYLEHGTPIKKETDELVIRAVEKADEVFFRALFVDQEVMKNFTDHEACFSQLTPSQWKEKQTLAADQRLAQLVKRWAEDRDPFSGFVIIDKKTAKTLAHVTAGHTDPTTAGTTEIALMIPKKEWNHRNGTFAIEFIKNYLVALSRIYLKWSGMPLQIDEGDFSEITAMVRLGNQYSIRIFDKNMTRCGEIDKWNLRWAQYKTPVLPSSTVSSHTSALPLQAKL